ncbi:MAG: hypothetical protein ACM33T_11160 [Solirubrobacterales bacterium]
MADQKDRPPLAKPEAPPQPSPPVQPGREAAKPENAEPLDPEKFKRPAKPTDG